MSSEKEIPNSNAVQEIQKSDITNEGKELIKIEENNAIQESLKTAEDVSTLSTVCSEEFSTEKENTGTKIDASENFISYSHSKETEVLNKLLKMGDIDKRFLYEELQNVKEDKLQDVLSEIEHMNSSLLKENEVYEFILKENETAQNSLDQIEVDDDISAQESFVLSYPEKCYFAKKKLEHTQKELELKKAGYTLELQNLSFELESLNLSLKDLQTSQKTFDKNIRIGGHHPVTKKIILQKVVKYFDDSIRTKMALSNRYKIQIQSDIMERNKILSQIKAQEKRLASLDMTEFQKVQFEHKKSCRLLATYKEQLGKFKTKFSPLLQSTTEMKKALEREQSEMEKMKNTVSKLEHLKKVMLTEKARNDQKALELKASMRKIKLDPRRHNLPEVIDYAAAKRENAILMKNISKWQKKVEVVQQEKLLYLNALSKKKKL